jgi:hypothetical protein
MRDYAKTISKIIYRLSFVLIIISIIGIAQFVFIGQKSQITIWIYDINDSGFRVGLQNYGNGKDNVLAIYFDNRTVYRYSVSPRLPYEMPAGEVNGNITVTRKLFTGNHTIEIVMEKFVPDELDSGSYGGILFPFTYIRNEDVGI